MTEIEQVRLLIGATISDTFTDAQIQGFLDIEGSVKVAAAAAIEAYVATLEMSSETIGDYMYKRANLLALAKGLRESATTDPASAVAAFDWTEG